MEAKLSALKLSALKKGDTVTVKGELEMGAIIATKRGRRNCDRPSGGAQSATGHLGTGADK